MQPGQAPKLGVYIFGCSEFGSKIAALATGSLAAQLVVEGYKSWLDEVTPETRLRIRQARYCNTARAPADPQAREAFRQEMLKSWDTPLKKEFFLVRCHALSRI